MRMQNTVLQGTMIQSAYDTNTDGTNDYICLDETFSKSMPSKAMRQTANHKNKQKIA